MVFIEFVKVKFGLFFKKVFLKTKSSMWITGMMFTEGCSLIVIRIFVGAEGGT